MKLFERIAITIIAVLALAGCGSATEVGNPTADVPTRIVTGVIDASISADTAALKDLPSVQESSAIDPVQLSVVAEASPTDIEQAPVQRDGSFTITVQIMKRYQWSVYLESVKLADFSFAEAGSLARSNELEIETEGDPIDLGIVRYQGGKFVPENEPVQQRGVYVGGNIGAGNGGNAP